MSRFPCLEAKQEGSGSFRYAAGTTLIKNTQVHTAKLGASCWPEKDAEHPMLQRRCGVPSGGGRCKGGNMTSVPTFRLTLLEVSPGSGHLPVSVLTVQGETHRSQSGICDKHRAPLWGSVNTQESTQDHTSAGACSFLLESGSVKGLRATLHWGPACLC